MVEETSGRRDSYVLAWIASLRVRLRLSPREPHCPHVLSRVRLFAIPQTVACQAGPSVHGIFQARTQVGGHFLLHGIFLTQELNLCLLCLLPWWIVSH